MMPARWVQTCSILAVFFLCITKVYASAICPPPSGKVVLLLQAADETTQSCDMASFDSLPQHSIETRLPVSLEIAGKNTWSGVYLADIARELGAKPESSIELIALNDYIVTIPMSDILIYNPVLASRVNGDLIPIRNKGPFILIYPFDQNNEINTALYQDYTIWMVHEILIR